MNYGDLGPTGHFLLKGYIMKHGLSLLLSYSVEGLEVKLPLILCCSRYSHCVSSQEI